MRRLALLTDEEVRSVMGRVARRISGPGGVFQKHFQRGQSDWDEPGSKYSKLKKKRGKQKFVLTGRAKRAMVNPSSRDRWISITASGNVARLAMGLRRMEKGRNVYDILQRGRFKGATAAGRFGRTITLSANDVRNRQLRTSAAIRKDKRRTGGKNMRKILDKNRIKDFKRTRAMPVVPVQPGDDSLVAPHITKCVQDMLRKRGLL